METNKMIKIALLSAMGFILYYVFQIPFPFIPFIEFDLSDVPAIIASIILGPFSAVMVQFIKNLLHLMTNSSTGGVGEVANFIMGSCLVIPIGLVMKNDKSTKKFIIGMILGVLLASVVACILNFFILIPLYAALYGINFDGIVDSVAAVNSLVDSKLTLILYGVLPANILKGTIVSLVSYFLYRFLKDPLLKISKNIQ